jgi:hypothetical protein
MYVLNIRSPPVVAVLLHGKNFCAATWEPTIKHLVAAGYRVIASDQIGFCKSSKPAAYQFTFKQLAGNTLQCSFAPDVANALVSHCRIDNGVRDRAMAHKGLQRSRIDPAGRQGVPSSMAQHVRMDREWQLSKLAKAFNQLLRAVDGKGRLALG